MGSRWCVGGDWDTERPMTNVSLSKVPHSTPHPHPPHSLSTFHHWASSMAKVLKMLRDDHEEEQLSNCVAGFFSLARDSVIQKETR